MFLFRSLSALFYLVILAGVLSKSAQAHHDEPVIQQSSTELTRVEWTWTHPTTREDGTPLTQAEIAHYHIYVVGAGEGGGDLLLAELDGTMTNFDILTDLTGTYCSYMLTMDTGNRVSQRSAEVCANIDSPPNPPVINSLTVTVEVSGS